MKKYLVKLVFKVCVETQGERSEFDEQMRVLFARNAEEAFYKARSMGKKEEEVFKSGGEKSIAWVFIDVSELYAIEAVNDGEQLYSRTYKMQDEKAFIHYVKQKSMEIQVKNLNFA